MFYWVSASDGRTSVQTDLLVPTPQMTFDLFIKENNDSSIHFKFHQLQYTGAQSSRKTHSI